MWTMHCWEGTGGVGGVVMLVPEQIIGYGLGIPNTWVPSCKLMKGADPYLQDNEALFVFLHSDLKIIPGVH